MGEESPGELRIAERGVHPPEQMDAALHTDDPLIEVRRLDAGYEGSPVLTGADFSIGRGEVFGILGGSGSGKSTLLKVMVGLLPPLAGDVLIDGESIVTAQGAARKRLLCRFGVMYQKGALFGSRTLLENILLPMEEHTRLPREAMEQIARMKLALVGLSDAADLVPAELSGGMIKRAALARSIALDPAIVFLDEPSAGLDPITSADLDALIVRVARTLGMTFVVVSHELPSMLSIANRVILLDRDAPDIIAAGHPVALRDHGADPRVCRFFHRKASI